MTKLRWGVLCVALALVVTAAPAIAQSDAKEKPTATDVGITPTEIHIATIADVDNSFAPGLFKASVDGVRGRGEVHQRHRRVSRAASSCSTSTTRT